MNSADLLQYGAGRAFDVLGQVVGDLTQEQADWIPPGIANPIGALYWHLVSSLDATVHGWCRDQPPLFESAGWREKVVVASPPEDEQDGLERMRATRVDLPALHDYALATSDAIQGWLASLSAQDLERTMETPIGELNLGQMLDTFVVWHVNAHCGEIAALKGCQGARGYPF